MLCHEENKSLSVRFMGLDIGITRCGGHCIHSLQGCQSYYTQQETTHVGIVCTLVATVFTRTEVNTDSSSYEILCALSAQNEVKKKRDS